MSGNRRFVDTNILLYAHDDSAGAKRDKARTLVEQLWESRDGCLSVQALQEFFVNVTRKIAKPLSVVRVENPFQPPKLRAADAFYEVLPGLRDSMLDLGGVG